MTCSSGEAWLLPSAIYAIVMQRPRDAALSGADDAGGDVAQDRRPAR
ncbi:hypothetical protein SARI_02815 [Salmonella enterica subsp. arizonae serovar 62:z4,z23:-]|uniref:Uncharacterized protein n=1 Tax=Salmonella arizonae (strain ATCC BAA-731 / CDC346-86 / RSK2980) TaxID=41514 RepID=A9MPL9_SALAR|nr:hypothetical protein SARI_02815 [Salmonella enterica subsp. arizonae serovar 62:z4,z23:-]